MINLVIPRGCDFFDFRSPSSPAGTGSYQAQANGLGCDNDKGVRAESPIQSPV
jgi:hypothetical protein